MKVRAKKLCFHLGRRYPGEVFEYDREVKAENLPDWLEVVDEGTPVARAEPDAPATPEPKALSEIAPKTPEKEAETFSDLNEQDSPDPDLEAFLS